MLLAILSSFLQHSLLLGARSNSCEPYWWSDPQCTSAHPLCSSVEPYGNLTLEESESLLRTLFSVVNSAVENGSISPLCGRAFPLLYCHQVYRRCSTAVPNSSEEDNGGSLCQDDCSEALSECQQDLLFLTDLVNSMSNLPPLLTNCSTEDYMFEMKCIPITAGKDQCSVNKHCSLLAFLLRVCFCIQSNVPERLYFSPPLAWQLTNNFLLSH